MRQKRLAGRFADGGGKGIVAAEGDDAGGKGRADVPVCGAVLCGAGEGIGSQEHRRYRREPGQQGFVRQGSQRGSGGIFARDDLHGGGGASENGSGEPAGDTAASGD